MSVSRLSLDDLVDPALWNALIDQVNEDAASIASINIRIASWTPTEDNVSFTSKSGWYVRIGSLVFASFVATWPSNSDVNQVSIGGLPFTVGAGAFPNPMEGAGSCIWSDYTDQRLNTEGLQNTKKLWLVPTIGNASSITNQIMSGKSINAYLLYETTDA